MFEFLEYKDVCLSFCNLALLLSVLYIWTPVEIILENDPQCGANIFSTICNGMPFDAVNCHTGFDVWSIEIYGAKRHSVAN